MRECFAYSPKSRWDTKNGRVLQAREDWVNSVVVGGKGG